MFSHFRLDVHCVCVCVCARARARVCVCSCVCLLCPSGTQFCTLDTRPTHGEYQSGCFSVKVSVNSDKVQGLQSTQ